MENKENYQKVNDKAKFLKEYDFAKNAIEVPEEIDIEKFLKSLEFVKNKKNFIEHLQGKIDAQNRLTYLCLIESTLKEPDIILTKEARTIKIKPFKKKNSDKIFEIVISEENDTILISSIPTHKEYYVRSQVQSADLIQIFTSRDSKDTEVPLGLPNYTNNRSIAQSTTQSQTTKSNHAHKAQNNHKSKSNHNERGL